MRLKSGQTGDAVGRASWRSSFLGHPGEKFLCGKLKRITKKEKSSKKERREGLWKLTLRWKSAKNADSPRSLKTASPTTLGFFTVPTGPTTTNRPHPKLTYRSRKMVLTLGSTTFVRATLRPLLRTIRQSPPCQHRLDKSSTLI